LLDGEEVGAGAVEVDPVVGEGGDDLVKSVLHIFQSSQAPEARSENIELAENLGGVLVAFVIALMVVTEFLSAKGRGTAVRAVWLRVVTKADGHGEPPKSGPSAVSHQLSAKGKQQFETDCRCADSKGQRAWRGLRPDKLQA
jgi:hypothetical protein